MTQKLDGRVALVTGGARGIGASIVQTLAAQGADIAILDQRRICDTSRTRSERHAHSICTGPPVWLAQPC